MPERESSAGASLPTSDVFETAMPEAERALRERALQHEALRRPEQSDLAGDTAKLLYELRVHQVELEMQNEELRRAQLEIEASRARYFELYDLAPVGYLTVTEKGLVSEANLTVAGTLALARGELVSQPFTRFIVAADQDVFFAYRRGLLASGELRSCELRLLRKGGEPFWARLEGRAARNPEGGLELRTVLSDVDERRRLQEAMRVSEERHRILFESSREALLTLSPPAWRFTSANRAALALFGAESEAELCARTPWEYSPSRQPDGRSSHERALALVEQALRSGSHSFEWTFERTPGDEFRASVVWSRLELEGVQLLQAIVRDESEAQRQRASLAQTERLASMGMLAASVGHEINNPLSYLLANLELLAEELRAGDGVTKGTSRERVERLTSLVVDALDGARRIAGIARVLNSFARVDTFEPAGADLNRSIEAAVTLAFNQIRFGGELGLDYGEVPKVRGSESKLSQVFLNLLVNASHAMETGKTPEPRISIRTWAEADRVFAEVVDTGKGISPAELEQIFEPFFSTKRVGVGSGLGLAICRKILAEFAGDIRVESKLGGGTRFVVSLPAWLGNAEAGALSGHIVAPQPAPRGRILLVDDEELVLLSMARMLAAHEIVSVHSGTEAKALLERDQDFDLVICDLMMPDLTGIDLHRWLMGHSPALAENLAFVSGGAFGQISTEYLLQCGNLRIDKPFDCAEFQRVVGEKIRAIRGGQPRSQGSQGSGLRGAPDQE